MTNSMDKIRRLPCWKGAVDPQPLGGGITNHNYVVEDQSGKYVVRFGEDIPVHHVMRFNELAASHAAFEAGISPEVVFNSQGILVMRFIEGICFDEVAVRQQHNLERILPLLKRVHRELPNYFRGPALVFWVFHVIRDYVATLRRAKHQPHGAGELGWLLEMAAELETAVGQIDLVFGHNDLLAANFMDDGKRLWLIDWDYAGYNSPLFDLGGLVSNSGLGSDSENWLLEQYFEQPVTDELYRKYAAMKCASLLRETLWSMVSEVHSDIDFDFRQYTRDNLVKFKQQLLAFQKVSK
ncbi:choline kinase family protein [Kiloniella laminariae]|uniref:Choline kinase family protein n=1 Tax=Kiloniella laminariae TaxID=454162 RepID=A0ABT4LLE9_9PROT|nr:choline kinase family protein [Kiloniella laminariae]MCZ4281929.1 choline kinase family protein [Kiloniella laminariae]